MELIRNNSLVFLFPLIIYCAALSAAHSKNDCVYTAYIRTGSNINGGTDAKIGLRLYDADKNSFDIDDLEAWGGLMGQGHNYFERGNLDIFSGRGPCLKGPVCAVNLTSDGSGLLSGWYCDYVEVISTGPHISCAQKFFKIEQWLATDAPPYRLYAFKNYCPWNTSVAPSIPMKSLDVSESVGSAYV
ncbi:hypothetical protein Syun_013627 [Stephania yunnanensis]|uniref:PLAT domain-containing protein n=1 Tax=Stephania yunnanensis TaxID=152371 RepID=A0AAP0JJZ9_9MAGN